MSCTQTGELTAYLDGELLPLRARQLEAHLGGCEDCRQALAKLRGAALAVQRLSPLSVSPGFKAAVLARAATQQSVAGRLAALFRPRILAPALAASVAVAVLGLRLIQGDEAPASPEQLEVATHLDVIADYDVLGLEESDLEVVAQLHELEGPK